MKRKKYAGHLLIVSICSQMWYAGDRIYEPFFLIVWPKFNINGINFKNELKFLYFGLRWETYVDFERSYNIFTWWINLYIKTTKEPLIVYILWLKYKRTHVHSSECKGLLFSFYHLHAWM